MTMKSMIGNHLDHRLRGTSPFDTYRACLVALHLEVSVSPDTYHTIIPRYLTPCKVDTLKGIIE